MGKWIDPAPLDTNEKRLAITEIIVYPDFDYTTVGPFDNNIAIIKVDGTFDCSPETIYPACLPSPEVRPRTPAQTSL